jgi:hypothetical protein
MARSTYIYVVLSYNEMVAAFTVKHELKTWWNRCDHPYQCDYEIWRIRDGDKEGLTKTPIHPGEL